MLTEVDRDILCEQSGVANEVLADFEDGRGAPLATDIAALQLGLETLGIEFLQESHGSGVGAKLKFSKGQNEAISNWEGEGGGAAEDSLP